MQLKLDDYEKDIDDTFLKQERVSNMKTQIEKLKQAAKTHYKSKETYNNTCLVTKI